MTDDPRCIKCGKPRSSHNYFGEFGYLCHNGSNTFRAEPEARTPSPEGERIVERVARIIDPSAWASMDGGHLARKRAMQKARAIVAALSSEREALGDEVKRAKETLERAETFRIDELPQDAGLMIAECCIAISNLLAAMSTALSSEREALVGELKGALVQAYRQGALDVHEHWAEANAEERGYLERDDDPDFTEAAHDYADAALAKVEASDAQV